MKNTRLLGDARFGRWFVEIHIGDDNKELVKIKDTKHIDILGIGFQQVASYYVETFLEGEDTFLKMQLDCEEWTLTQEEVTRIKNWLRMYQSRIWRNA
jgi:hypothetical protein